MGDRLDEDRRQLIAVLSDQLLGDLLVIERSDQCVFGIFRKRARRYRDRLDLIY